MAIRFMGYCPKSLVDPDYAARVEKLVFQSVSGGCAWYLEGEERTGEIDFGKRGWLASLVAAEADRSMANLKALAAVAPKGTVKVQALGSVHLCSGDEEVHVHFHEDVFASVIGERRIGNSVSVVVPAAEEVDWFGRAQTFFRSGEFEYGYACERKQYESLNIDRSCGVEAVGLDMGRYFPGFYWGNYFSERLNQKLGFSEALEGMPMYIAARLNQGVLVCGEYLPWEWDRADSSLASEQAVERLGRDLFFRLGGTSLDDGRASRISECFLASG